MGTCNQCGKPTGESSAIRCDDCFAAQPTLTDGAALHPAPAVNPEAVTLDAIRTLWGAASAPDIHASQTLRTPDHTPLQEKQLAIQEHTVHSPKESPEAEADYELLELVGQGGMGVIYTARQACIDRTIAVKMIRPEAASEPKTRAKFADEAAVTGALDHPNIVPIHELARGNDDCLFYAMKYVQGVSWTERIHSLSLDENLDILLSVADAIAFAHTQGVIHRDLKPDNIMLGDFGEVLVMDWGLAASVNTAGRAKPLQQGGAMGGTPLYMAPEMASGEAERITELSDIYLLGALLYEVITGKPPHPVGQDIMECLLFAAENRIRPTEKAGELTHIALKAMATAPEERYPSAKDFQQAIRQYRTHANSLQLSEHAQQHLNTAKQTQAYDDYARSLFSFREAVELWAENEAAHAGVEDAAYHYATRALERGDLDLSESLLLSDSPRQADLRERVQAEGRRRRSHQRLLKTLLISSAVAAIASIAILALAMVEIRQHGEEEVATYRQNTMAKIKQGLKDNVDIAYAAVDSNYRQASNPAYLEKRYGPVLQGMTRFAMVILNRYAEQVADGKLSQDKAMQQAADELRAVRFNHGHGYLWINDMGSPFPRMVMHPTQPALEGKVLKDKRFNCALGKDKNLFVAMHERCREKGGGFIDYLWPRADSQDQTTRVPKLSYVQGFPRWGWIVGAGVYVEDARQDAIRKSLDDLRAMRYNNDIGYFWVCDSTRPVPKMLMHPTLPKLEGTILNDPKYNCAGDRKTNLFIEARDQCSRAGGGFVAYRWPKPTPDGLLPDMPKLTYVRLYKPLGWVIGSGAYTDEIDRTLNRQESAMKAHIQTLTDNLLFTFGGIVLVGLCIIAGREIHARRQRPPQSYSQ
ncbi:MAG: cache domain-containing protein [Planctomycetota bacterium]|jgi:serine/threonine protein kinase